MTLIVTPTGLFRGTSVTRTMINVTGGEFGKSPDSEGSHARSMLRTLDSECDKNVNGGRLKRRNRVMPSG